MPLQKSQPFTFVFASRKGDGTANDSIAPTLTLVKDGAAGVALTGAARVTGTAFTWAVALSAAQMNANSVYLEHAGTGLELWGVDLLAEGDYTAARAGKLDNLDVAITSRLAGEDYELPPTAQASASAVWAFIPPVAPGLPPPPTPYNSIARKGDAMTLTILERTAISDRLERPGGVLDAINTLSGKITTMLVSAGAGLISRFSASALQNAPIGEGGGGGTNGVTQNVRGPLTITPINSYIDDAPQTCFVGDRFGLLLILRDGAGNAVSVAEGTPVWVTVSAGGQVLTDAAAASIEYGSGGVIRYDLQEADTENGGKKQLTVTVGEANNAQTWGPMPLVVRAK